MTVHNREGNLFSLSTLYILFLACPLWHWWWMFNNGPSAPMQSTDNKTAQSIYFLNNNLLESLLNLFPSSSTSSRTSSRTSTCIILLYIAHLEHITFFFINLYYVMSSACLVAWDRPAKLSETFCNVIIAVRFRIVWATVQNSWLKCNRHLCN